MKTTAILVATSFALLGVAATGAAHPLDILGLAYVDPHPDHTVEHLLEGEVPEDPEFHVWVETNGCAGLQKNEAALGRDGCTTTEIDTMVA